MKKALLVLAISIVLVPAAIAQSMDIGQRQFQNRLVCGPSLVSKPIAVQRYAPNNNYDFVGYYELNIYNCTSSMFDREQLMSEERPIQPKRRRW